MTITAFAHAVLILCEPIRDLEPIFESDSFNSPLTGPGVLPACNMRGVSRVLAVGGRAPWAAQIPVCQCRVVPSGIEPTSDTIPSASIAFRASASAALSLGKESSHTVEFPNSSTTSSSQPPLPSS